MLGQRCYQALKDIPEPVDIVDCFRPARDIPPLARAAAMEVIMHRCMKIEFVRLFGGPGWVSVNTKIIVKKFRMFLMTLFLLNTKIIVKKFRMFLMTLFLLGICSYGYAQEEAINLPTYPLTDEYYQAYRWFYYDSYQLMLEVIGDDTLALPLEDFSKLSLESQYNVCLVSMDYTFFRSAMLDALSKSKLLNRRRLGFLLIKTFADVTGISWNFKRKISEEEQDKIRQMKDVFENEHHLQMGI